MHISAVIITTTTATIIIIHIPSVRQHELFVSGSDFEGKTRD